MQQRFGENVGQLFGSKSCIDIEVSSSIWPTFRVILLGPYLFHWFFGLSINCKWREIGNFFTMWSTRYFLLQGRTFCTKLHSIIYIFSHCIWKKSHPSVEMSSNWEIREVMNFLVFAYLPLSVITFCNLSALRRLQFLRIWKSRIENLWFTKNIQ